MFSLFRVFRFESSIVRIRYFFVRFSFFLFCLGVAQTIRSQDEANKKHLTTSYHQVIEVLLTISEKKTLAMSEFRREMTEEKFNTALEKLERIDQSCREINEHCPHPSSFDAVTEIAHHLQDLIEKLGLVSSTMSQSPNNNVDH